MKTGEPVIVRLADDIFMSASDLQVVKSRVASTILVYGDVGLRTSLLRGASSDFMVASDVYYHIEAYPISTSGQPCTPENQRPGSRTAQCQPRESIRGTGGRSAAAAI